MVPFLTARMYRGGNTTRNLVRVPPPLPYGCPPGMEMYAKEWLGKVDA